MFCDVGPHAVQRPVVVLSEYDALLVLLIGLEAQLCQCVCIVSCFYYTLCLVNSHIQPVIVSITLLCICWRLAFLETLFSTLH